MKNIEHNVLRQIKLFLYYLALEINRADETRVKKLRDNKMVT